MLSKYTMTSMTEMIDNIRSTTITGPACDIACNMVVVVRGTSGVTGAGVCARSDEALAGARNSHRIFSCPDNRYDKRRALARNQRSVKTAQTKDMGRASCWIELDVIAPPVPGITRIIEQIVHLIWLAFSVTE